MYIKELIYNAPKTEYKFDGNGKLVEAKPTGLSGIEKINVLYAEKGFALRKKETSETLSKSIALTKNDSIENYEEIELPGGAI